jgi:predicted transcriptional regulator
MDAQSSNPHLTAKIVGSYLRHHTVGASELPKLITSVHRALTEVERPKASGGAANSSSTGETIRPPGLRYLP